MPRLLLRFSARSYRLFGWKMSALHISQGEKSEQAKKDTYLRATIGHEKTLADNEDEREEIGFFEMGVTETKQNENSQLVFRRNFIVRGYVVRA